MDMCGMRWNPEECSMQACCRGFDFLKIYKKESRDHLSGWQETIGNETCLNFANHVTSDSDSCHRPKKFLQRFCISRSSSNSLTVLPR